MRQTKRLVVIDGKSVFYRGYYALPNLTTKDGTPTGGVYGFALMAIDAIKKFKPDYMVVAWDKPKTNIRRRVAIYPQYKANRKPAPPDFYEQVPLLIRLIDAFGWPFYEIDDHEADDIMATIAKRAKAKGVETILVTSDHDVLQLIDDHTKVALLKRGLTNVDLVDEKRMRQLYGLTPAQFIDYKALKGDTADNMPGVSGVGDKTAKKLILKYRSLDGVYSHLDEIKGKLRERLERDRDQAFLTRQLVILDDEIKLDFNLRNARIDHVDKVRLHELLKELQFSNLIRQLPEEFKLNEASLRQLAQREGKFVFAAKINVIFNQDDLKQLNLANCKEIVLLARVVDRHFKAVSHIFLSPKPGECILFDLTGNLDAALVADKLKPLLEDASIKKYGHDTKRILRVLLHHGVEVSQIDFDTEVAAFLLNPLRRNLSLTALSEELLGYEGDSLDELAPMDVQASAGKVVNAVWGLKERLASELAKLKRLNRVAVEIDFPVIKVLARMEHIGVKIDKHYLKQMSEELADEISDIEQKIYGYADQEFNIASPQQLARILFDKLGLPTQDIKKGKSGYSTAASELAKLRGLHPIIDLISRYREYTKLKNTYIDALPRLTDEADRLHTHFSLTVAQTGRLSSSDPNLQNIPVRTKIGRRIRRAFVADKGEVFVSADYNQFELRLAAAIAGDDDLIEAFNDGLDIHTRTASQVYGVAMDDVTKKQRRDAKVINFGVLYGMSPHGLSQATGMSRDEAKLFIERYFKLRQPLLDYIETTKEKALKDGYVETLFGRRRPTPDVKSSNYAVREAALRQAVNMPIQGTEADLMKMAMIKIADELGGDAKMLLQIHDSILVEVSEWKAKKVGRQIKDIMENIYKLPVNLDVDVSIGKTWADL